MGIYQTQIYFTLKGNNSCDQLCSKHVTQQVIARIVLRVTTDSQCKNMQRILYIEILIARIKITISGIFVFTLRKIILVPNSLRVCLIFLSYPMLWQECIVLCVTELALRIVANYVPLPHPPRTPAMLGGTYCFCPFCLFVHSSIWHKFVSTL